MCVQFTPSNEFLVIQVATVWLDSDDDDDNLDGDDVNDDDDDDNNCVEDDDNDNEDETTTMIVMNMSTTAVCALMLTKLMLPAFFCFSGRTTKGSYKNQSLAFGSWQCHICLGE